MPKMLHVILRKNSNCRRIILLRVICVYYDSTHGFQPFLDSIGIKAGDHYIFVNLLPETVAVKQEPIPRFHTQLRAVNLYLRLFLYEDTEQLIAILVVPHRI